MGCPQCLLNIQVRELPVHEPQPLKIKPSRSCSESGCFVLKNLPHDPTTLPIFCGVRLPRTIEESMAPFSGRFGGSLPRRGVARFSFAWDPNRRALGRPEPERPAMIEDSALASGGSRSVDGLGQRRGANAGYGWGNQDPLGLIAPQLGQNHSFSIGGGMIGGTVGGQIQVSHVVLGIEADGDWARINGSSTATIPLLPGTTLTLYLPRGRGSVTLLTIGSSIARSASRRWMGARGARF
jgi:hypothetical protein